MANFKTHITTSTALGIAYGGTAYLGFDLAMQDCVIAGGLCSIAGMLPDLDSDSGVPVRETLCFVSAVIPMLMIPRFGAMGMEPESMVVAAGLMYLVIRFGIGTLFKKYTVHRGMWHSIPAALIAGMIAFEACMCHDIAVRLFKAGAVVLGFMSHLVLDEIYSVDLSGRKIRLKKSFGTALKFYSQRTWANVSTYAKVVLMAVIIAGDSAAMRYFGYEAIEIPETASNWIGGWLPAEESEDGRPTYVVEPTIRR